MYIETELIVTSEGFVVDSDNKAEWAIKKLKEEQQEADRLISICESQIEQYKNKIDAYKHELELKSSGLKGILQQYFETVPHKTTKTQETYKLPSGTLKLKFKEKIIKDDEKLLKWLDSNGQDEYILTNKSASWGEFKKTLQKVDGKFVTEDGGIVEGVTVEDAEAEFSID